MYLGLGEEQAKKSQPKHRNSLTDDGISARSGKDGRSCQNPSTLKSHLTAVSSLSSFQEGYSLPRSLLESVISYLH